MTDTQSKKAVKSTNALNPIAAGIAGVVVGGAAVAAAVMMSNKKNQEKVIKAFDRAKNNVAEYVDNVKSQPIIEKSTQKIHEVATEVKKKIEEQT